MEQDNAAFFLCKPTEELQLKSELAIIIFPCCVGSSFSVAEIITFVLRLFKLQVEFVASVQLWGAARRVRAWAYRAPPKLSSSSGRGSASQHVMSISGGQGEGSGWF